MAATSARRRREPSEEVDEEDVQAIFRRAFEARFKPLPEEPKRRKTEPEPVSDEEDEEDDDNDNDESDWSGISDDEPTTVQVIEYQPTQHTNLDADRAQKRAFMSSKPPVSSTPSLLSTTTATKKPDSADALEATNLKNDLALQKLLRESHLLSTSSSGTSTPTLSTTGIARHKSADLHMQSLGAKASVFAQKKMSMAQRKHEALKARVAEERRRAGAREAGIVLEREVRGKKEGEKKRERGVGGPSVGRMRGGTLSLSKRDVRSITGGGGGGAGRGKGKMRGRGKKVPF